MLTYRNISWECQNLIEGFDCSDEISVELFLKEQAFMLHHLRSAVTRLYFDENQNLVGYFALYNDHVHVFANQMTKYGWNLPEGLDLFPAVKLHYLGVDRKYRNRGYGEYLLGEVVELVEDIAKTSGCNFLTIEALPNAVEFYAKYGFQIRSRQSGKGEFYHMVLKLDELEE
ncbi:GNAT family N-acetyltransferase [Paenibacillus hexagrammi]|uniref:GNAT family N-acetyltransferase n=1 Tax=Paenibacillus hexagrammi TaxID=2908839 RepID=A0ABY3SEE9_9BACL|nr:GNAT family N-acetyltransferase [Paenibacillus sp. YPD9-1]UJF32377.1 GNAT family N-acetyltransferase [Paenibacillus sp. YPD9-1]